MAEYSNRPARVVIINQHSVNVGDEAAGYALIEKMIKDYLIKSIDIFYNGSEAIPCPPNSSEIVRHDLDLSLKRMGYVAIAIYLLTGIKANSTVKRFCETVKNADVVFVAPGGANIGIYRSWRYLVRLLFAVKVGKTPIFHWNTIGKSESKVFDFIARKVLSNSKIYVREKKSCEYLKSIGILSELGPDTAFLLEPIPHVLESNTLAFVPSELDSWHPYFRRRPINEFILNEYVPTIGKFARSRGYSIDIIPHLRDETERRFNEKVCSVLRESGCKARIRSDIEDFRDYDAALAQADMIVGMRYHTAVLSAKNYRPFITLAYENKAIEVATYTGMEQFCIDLNGDRPRGDRVLNLLEDLESQMDAVPDKLRRVCESTLIPRAAYVLENELWKYRKSN